LVRFDEEPPPTGKPVDLGVSSANLLGKMVPGLGYSCIKPWLHHDNSAPNHVATLGYETGFIQVEGIASSETNAALIADYVANLGPEHEGRPLILFGYSKGVPDIFAFLVAYPELTERVAAVVSYAGAVWGSPLADAADEKQLRWLTHIPGAECEKKDSKALETLSPANREAWFAQHTLPEHIRYYSVIAFPDPDNISNGLQRTHKQLGAMKDARNDSQVVFYDQVIPGSTILGFFNADHWAMSVPIARQHEIVQTLFADQNDFPREIALEAILRYIEEDLDTDAHRAISE
jgi:pimeloyl-ACP methyl ester carboxylesterase